MVAVLPTPGGPQRSSGVLVTRAADRVSRWLLSMVDSFLVTGGRSNGWGCQPRLWPALLLVLALRHELLEVLVDLLADAVEVSGCDLLVRLGQLVELGGQLALDLGLQVFQLLDDALVGGPDLVLGGDAQVFGQHLDQMVQAA